jgi:hypothetical protein
VRIGEGFGGSEEGDERDWRQGIKRE